MPRKPGKPNTFVKGMKTDVDPALQAKESYKFAQNIRLTSHEGNNVGAQPYESDSEVLNLIPGDISVAKNVGSTFGYSTDGGINFFTTQFYEPDAGDLIEGTYLGWYLGFNPGSPEDINMPLLSQAVQSGDLNPNEMLPAPVFVANGSDVYSLEDWNMTLSVVLTLNDDTKIAGKVSVADAYVYTNAATSSTAMTSLSTIIASAINGETFYVWDGTTDLETFLDSEPADDWEQVSIACFSVPDEQDFASNYAEMWSGSNSYYFINTTNASNHVKYMEIDYIGEYVVGSTLLQWYYTVLIFLRTAYPTQDLTYLQQESWAYAEWILAQDFQIQSQEQSDIVILSAEQEGAGETIVTPYPLYNQEVINFADLEGVDVTDAPSGIYGIEILGTYAFSDYLVIMGKWPLISYVQGTASTAITESVGGLQFDAGDIGDVVLKVKTNHKGEITDMNGNLGAFTIYYIGDLSFKSMSKLKITGAEENPLTRRIYFTDGKSPLKSMNVGLPAATYAEYTTRPDFFNLFSPAVFGELKVTGMQEGGALDSVGHSYCYRYKTVDGRLSQTSVLTNPASLPVTGKSVEYSFTKGGSVGTSTGKSIIGQITKCDARYSKVQIIHLAVLPDGPAEIAEVIGEFPIPSADANGNNTVEWIHTGTENIDEELNLAELATQGVVWDTCQALETKDNRLFCGNLSGDESLIINTDFTVASYDSENRHHSYDSGNPNLYHDLMYSSSGVDYSQGSTQGHIYESQNPTSGLYNDTNIDSNNGGNYGSPTKFYRYIRKCSWNSDTQEFVDDTTAYHDVPKNVFAGNACEFYSGYSQDTMWKRGVWGAESKYFQSRIPEGEENAGEYEGVRVTFRVLGSHWDDPAPPLNLDETGLNASGGLKAAPPYYRVSADGDTDNFYANYTNPIYNSNYVGYRRGEVYRFGILFFDKSGSPLFVKRIGDIRMPEHSTEYIVPKYGTNGEVNGCSQPWPYYFQTARDEKDQGFSSWHDAYKEDENQIDFFMQPYNNMVEGYEYDTDWQAANPDQVEAGNSAGYSPLREYHPQVLAVGGYNRWKSGNKDGVKGGIVYPYFEVKLSTKTSRNIGGYSIVRVNRDVDNRTIVTSGLLSRAVNFDWQSKYNVDNGGTWAELHGMTDTLGPDPQGNFTRMHQYVGLEANVLNGGNTSMYGPSSLDGQITLNSSTNSSPSVDMWKQGDDIDDVGAQPSNVYTLDSPDVTNNDDFSLGFTAGDRLKLVEAAYCHKQNSGNIASAGYSSTDAMIQAAMFWCDRAKRPDATYDTWYPSGGYYWWGRAPQSRDMFGCYVDKPYLQDDPIAYGGESIDSGGWSHIGVGFTAGSTNYGDNGYEPGMENDLGTGDVWQNWGPDQQSQVQLHPFLYTKYYNKRIPGYPFYGMPRVDWVNSNDNVSVGTAVLTSTAATSTDSNWMGDAEDNHYSSNYYFYGENYDPDGGGDVGDVPSAFVPRASGLPISGFYSSIGRLDFGENSSHGTGSGSQDQKYYPESKITYAKVVGPGESVSAAQLASPTDFKNQTIWQAPNLLGYYKWRFPFLTNRDIYGGPHNRAGSISGNKKIVFSLPKACAIPITRHMINYYNYPEKVHRAMSARHEIASPSFFNETGNARLAPETQIASISKKQSLQSMYGGYDISAWSKNAFRTTGHYRAVQNNITQDVSGAVQHIGHWGANKVFGGDTFICNYSVKKGKMRETGEEFIDNCRGGHAFTCPIETETNIDLTHGLRFYNNGASIPSEILDDNHYNEAYDGENNSMDYRTKNVDFMEVSHWPSTIAWSEPKKPGEIEDSYSIFPVNQIKDLDYSKGPITQLFKLSDKLFSTQFSGVAGISVNPRVLIQTEDQNAIQAATGTDAVVERYDYVSENYGSQHFHNLVVSDNSAYFYDNDNAKFFRLGAGEKGGLALTSLGDKLACQGIFNDFRDNVIHDNPLTIRSHWVAGAEYNYWHHMQEGTVDYYSNVYTPNAIYHVPWITEYSDNKNIEGFGSTGCGGISLGYDPQYNEILLTLAPDRGVPRTIVYNENIDVFTSFISKRASNYFNYKGRMYCTYNQNVEYENEKNSKIYLANKISNPFSATAESYTQSYGNIDINGFAQKFLNFGNNDYYVWECIHATNPTDFMVPVYESPYQTLVEFQKQSTLLTPTYSLPQDSSVYCYAQKEPIQLEVIFNDNPLQNKVFDKMQINLDAKTDYGKRKLYFRKFAMLGSGNRFPIVEHDRIDDQSSWGLELQSADGQYEGAGTSWGQYEYKGTEAVVNLDGNDTAQNVMIYDFVPYDGYSAIQSASTYGAIASDAETTDAGFGNDGLLGDVGHRTWYSVKDGLHFVPMRRMSDYRVWTSTEGDWWNPGAALNLGENIEGYIGITENPFYGAGTGSATVDLQTVYSLMGDSLATAPFSSSLSDYWNTIAPGSIVAGNVDTKMDRVVRGTYARVIMTMGWKDSTKWELTDLPGAQEGEWNQSMPEVIEDTINSQFPSDDYENLPGDTTGGNALNQRLGVGGIKNQPFSIFSITPHYRLTKT